MEVKLAPILTSRLSTRTTKVFFIIISIIVSLYTTNLSSFVFMLKIFLYLKMKTIYKPFKWFATYPKNSTSIKGVF